LTRVIIPILLLLVAILAFAAVAYGTLPVWGQYSNGVEIIMLARQYQWPLVGLGIVACLALIGLVVAGKRRAWWLIGLAPVLVLFTHALFSDPLRGFKVFDKPEFVAADNATTVKPEDHVLGVVFNGKSYAIPYAHAYFTPVMFVTDHDRRMVVMYSPYANHASAAALGRDVYPRDFEIVSMPANGLLLYNKKLGEFINAVAGQTMKTKQRPTGFSEMLPVRRTTYADWRAAHPDTVVMALPEGKQAVVGKPLTPKFPTPMPGEREGVRVETPVAVLPTTRPVGILADAITDKPMNVSSPDFPLLVFRDPETGRMRAFVRRIDDLTPRFRLNADKRKKDVYLVDDDTKSDWTKDGKAVNGPAAKEKRVLAPVRVEEGLYWGVMKVWMPDVQLIDPKLAN
jgi:hypothetical protein